MVKIKDRNLPELAEIYNSGGKDALYKKLRESFGIKYPWSTLDRMKNIDYLGYNEATDRFSVTRTNKLCSPVKPQHICEDKTERNAPKAEVMEKLVKELIGDRLLELSRYVVIDTINKTMIIDKTALTDAGYTLVTH
ncbi:hypothetical protein SAMN04487928_14712 [Butyrivibrio proteoclasticus]|uniref:Uncharacterized protein n=1 Tax=Butyrivibrio proteoclasticus TaxID=43305 RepID=A0A1I5YIA5_9FIRM|nr:hypothetical protein [Butyrivibrio proteoclasticus]SFQ43900.1 hypothetical protein SAMN04487928_14712 [Butyrivibrio proteoclasticus]